jgi:hypothetical protein
MSGYSAHIMYLVAVTSASSVSASDLSIWPNASPAGMYPRHWMLILSAFCTFHVSMTAWMPTGTDTCRASMS